MVRSASSDRDVEVNDYGIQGSLYGIKSVRETRQRPESKDENDEYQIRPQHTAISSIDRQTSPVFEFAGPVSPTETSLISSPKHIPVSSPGDLIDDQVCCCCEETFLGAKQDLRGMNHVPATRFFGERKDLW